MGNIEDRFKEIEKGLTETFKRLPAIIGEEVVNFSLDNFQTESWQGNSTEPWQKRKSPTAWGKTDDQGRALLVKTGKLRRSIRVSDITEDKVTITAGGADVPYARAHNEGFTGQVHQHVREHYRRTRSGGTAKVKAFDRTINQNIPRRQFLGSGGDSSQLRAHLTDAVIAELKKI